jgi:hypothetical protein
MLVLPLNAEEKRRVAYVTIEALNLWAVFARAFYVSCALRALDDQGVRITTSQPSIRTQLDAITFAVHTDKPKLSSRLGPWSPFDEPPWTSLSRFENVMVALSPSNLAKVHGAVSYDPDAFRDLKAARNFMAHRSEATAAEMAAVARRNLLNPRLHPVDLLASRARARPQTLLADWLDALRIMIERCCF